MNAGGAVKTIWTIGHSTHKKEDFFTMLHSFGITLIADIRRFPGSGRLPHFNKDILEASLHENGIRYVHFPALGGRRSPHADSKNTAWRDASFQGYADYMETSAFINAVQELESLAEGHRTAYMCSEAVWWRCHRAMVSDCLKIRGWKVMHISGPAHCSQHPFTSPARVENGRLFYH